MKKLPLESLYDKLIRDNLPDLMPYESSDELKAKDPGLYQALECLGIAERAVEEKNRIIGSLQTDYARFGKEWSRLATQTYLLARKLGLIDELTGQWLSDFKEVSNTSAPDAAEEFASDEGIPQSETGKEIEAVPVAASKKNDSKPSAKRQSRPHLKNYPIAGKSPTTDELKASAARFECRSDWEFWAPADYSAAKRRGKAFIDSCCAHMPKRKHSNRKGPRLDDNGNPIYVVSMKYPKEVILATGRKYSSRYGWSMSIDGPVYQAACDAGVIDEACAHMGPKQSNSGLTEESFFEAALSFGSFSAFAEKNPKGVDYAIAKGWVARLMQAFSVNQKDVNDKKAAG